MKNRHYFILIFLILPFCTIWGQASPVFHHLPTDNGLLSNQVRSLLRDRQGFLWIGTAFGLNRYDGTRFKTYEYEPENPNSLMERDIISLQEDANGNIWVGGWSVYKVYLRDRDSFYDAAPILRDLGISVGSLRFVYTDRKGDLWIVSDHSLFYYQLKEHHLEEFSLQSRANISGMADDDTHVCVLSEDNQLFQLHIAAGVWKQIPLPEESGYINKIYQDGEGGIWLFSSRSDDVYYKKDVNKLWEHIILESFQSTQSNFVHSIQMDKNGGVWIATDHKGLFVYDKENNRMENILHDPLSQTSIKGNSIECMYYDDEDALWIGYTKNGVSCYHSRYQKFRNYQSDDYRNVNVIIEDKANNIWLGTDGHGIVYKKPFTDSIIKKLNIPGNIVVSMVQDDKGRLWIGTYLNGLICYDNGKLKQYTTSNSKLSDNSIWALCIDKSGYLWIGALWGCLQRMDTATDEFVDFDSENKHDTYVFNIICDGEKYIYAGTMSGVCRIDMQTLERNMYAGNSKGTQKFLRQHIQSVYQDKRGLLWLGHNKGVTVWDLKKDTLYYINKDEGLVGNIVKAISEDDRNHIWIAMDNGCSVVKVTTAVDGSLNFNFDNYSAIDDLSDNKLNQYAMCYLSSGAMALGKSDGYSVVNLRELNEKKLRPAKVMFTGLKISNKEIQVSEQVELEYYDRLITVEFTAMDLITSEQVRYAYMIKGLNEDWIYTSDNKVSFSYLSSGSYQLIVKASNGEGVWNENASVLYIKVLPPFWLSWYAYCLYSLLVVIFLVIQWKRLQHKNRKKLALQQINMEREHMIRLNEMKLRFFTNISHDFRTPLALIITPLQVMIEDMKDGETVRKLKLIYRNAEQLLNLVNELLDFRKLDVGAEILRLIPNEFVSYVNNIVDSFLIYANERKIAFTIVSEIDQVFMLFDADKISKIIFNLLSNAFKYTPDGGQIRVTIFRNGQNVGVSIADNGCGIPNDEKKHIFERFYQTIQDGEKTGSGIGLHIVSQYIELHKGMIYVEDNAPNGSIFTFTIPLLVPNEIEEEVIEESESNDIKNHHEHQSDTTLKLLLVEDNHDFIDFLYDNLKDEYTVLKAYNGKEALDILGRDDIDLIVSDAMMPVMGGFELCRQIKTNINWSHIPVIILTAKTTEEDKIQGLEYGADDYITKPFNFNILKLRINKFVEWTEKSHKTFKQVVDVNPSEITITSLDEQLVTKAINIVEKHIDEIDFSVETLSSAVGLTRGHLYKKLVSITGKTPSEFIKIIRLKRARQLLEESQMQVSEIAYAVGFNSPKIFARNFRMEFDISPSEYAKNPKKLSDDTSEEYL
ncbi:hybrid sensor histidine kinase/response regulator transcription factor [Bacteroides sp. 51]|uniref:hybrid sensor histidine kinase/response regulator transcription factor n=1 Tax=Bacteroides sp. 51 TaxID=2302938 RepID=UPI0013D3C285|nr:hybrid sensor histidine kinase/response regulator transcription factor [Bacteroides sp. 51]